jgi:hypothetical protein
MRLRGLIATRFRMVERRRFRTFAARLPRDERPGLVRRRFESPPPAYPDCRPSSYRRAQPEPAPARDDCRWGGSHEGDRLGLGELELIAKRMFGDAGCDFCRDVLDIVSRMGAADQDDLEAPREGSTSRAAVAHLGKETRDREAAHPASRNGPPGLSPRSRRRHAFLAPGSSPDGSAAGWIAQLPEPGSSRATFSNTRDRSISFPSSYLTVIVVLSHVYDVPVGWKK